MSPWVMSIELLDNYSLGQTPMERSRTSMCVCVHVRTCVLELRDILIDMVTSLFSRVRGTQDVGAFLLAACVEITY